MRRERLREALHEIHGAVPAAGAADRHGEVVAVVAGVFGKPRRDEPFDVGVHLLDGGFLLEERDDGQIASRQRLQLGLVVGVGEAAHVEHQIRIERHAVLEAERFELQRERAWVDADEVLDPRAKRDRRKCRSCRTLKPCGRASARSCALVVDRLGQRSLLARERMAPARFGKALDERLGLGVEVEKAHVPAERAQARDRVREPGEPRRDLGVERDRDAVAPGLREIARPSPRPATSADC